MRERKIRLPRYKKPKVAEIGGKETVLFTSGIMAAVIHRTPQVVRLWERTGILPETPFRNELGHRYYTREMIDVVKESVSGFATAGKVGGVLKHKDQIYASIKEGWNRLGINV